MKKITQLNEMAEKMASGEKVNLNNLSSFEKEIVTQTAAKMLSNQSAANSEVEMLKKLGTSIFS